MKLVDEGKINLDEDVSKYLGFELRNPNFPDEKITVRMLASHTSSLRDGKIYSIPPEVNVKEFFICGGKFFEDGAHFGTEKAGNFFTYCNLNYGLLGTIIESVSCTRFDIYQRENILKQIDSKADYLPCNFNRNEFEMLGTIYRKQNLIGQWNEFGDWFGKVDDFKGKQPARDTVTLQNPYNENFQHEYKLKDYVIGTNATIFSPQGGLRISFEELGNCLEMLMNGGNFRGRQILSNNSVSEMFKSQWIYNGKNGDTLNGVMLNYGLGFYRIEGNSSNRVCKNYCMDFIGHSGAAFGMLSGLFFIPNTKIGFIYMMNGEALSEENKLTQGKYSANYIWEEKIMNAICNFIMNFKHQKFF